MSKSKLTTQQWDDMEDKYTSGTSQVSLAEEYGVSKSLVCHKMRQRGHSRASVISGRVCPVVSSVLPTLPSRVLVNILPKASGCWEWQGATIKGYGAIRWDKKVQYLHRVVFAELNPSIDAPVVRHTCDNPLCCFPEHLIPGDQNLNVQDMMDRDRHYRKVTDCNVRAIRAEVGTLHEIGAKYEISHTQVWNIQKGHQRNRIQ